MPRTYVKTGRPPGRPRKVVEAGDQSPRDRTNASLALQATLKEIEVQTGMTLAPLSLPPVVLDGITDPEKRMRSAMDQLMAGLHPQLPILLQRIAIRRPDLVLKFYQEMTEYTTPKLSRLEQTGTVNVKHTHFVAVEDRERDPRKPAIELVPAADGTFVVPA